MDTQPPVAAARKITTLNRIALVLLLIVLLPALFYSAYEISSLSASEELFGTMYRQQLDAVLFSVNQYAWDVVSAWSGALENILAVKPPQSREETLKTLRSFIGQRQAVQTIFACDTSFRPRFSVGPSAPGRPATDGSRRNISRLLARDRDKIERLIEFRRVDYRKIESLGSVDSSTGEQPVTLVFVTRGSDTNTQIVGIVLDPRVFIRDIILRKLVEAAGNEFVLAVVDQKTGEILASTSDVQPRDLKQAKALWLFPALSLGIRLKGTTIDELVQSRFHRNMFLIVGLDIILIVGAFLVYRTMRREMELVRMKSDFISNVSHELRTPLSLIRMFAETLEMKRVGTERKKREYYRTILRETERLTRLVNNILNFSRMEADRRNYHFRPVDLNIVVNNVLSIYDYQLRERGFTTEIDLETTLPPIHADDEALAEALHNIVDNAIKYSPEKKTLEVRTGVNNDTVFVEVKDSGIGIAAEHHEKIFEKFYRVSGGLVYTTRGSGLGLALVRHIAAAHGGTVEVESTPGKGSTFRLNLPLRRARGAEG